MPRLRAKGMEAEATISKLSTIIQATLANKIARDEGKDNTPSLLACAEECEFERLKKESAIIFKYTNKQKIQRSLNTTIEAKIK